ncbi:MAG: hypothetical protein JSU98_00875 [Gemmatimonadales bacterium]|nr:MAG: hypothetical protein JSU98_00875 [Gemmatimonadales bacterium]
MRGADRGPLRRRAVLPGAILVMGAAACHSPGAGSGEPAPEPGEPCILGVLHAESTEVEEFLSLEAAEGVRVSLVDRTGEDIRWLNGAEVDACGPRPSGDVLEVRRFELRTVDGRPATLGRLRSRDGLLFLEPRDGGPALRLLSPPSALREAGDGRVGWVTGRDTQDGMVVQAYGLRPRTR